jgi:hypothetical protein
VPVASPPSAARQVVQVQAAAMPQVPVPKGKATGMLRSETILKINIENYEEN